MPTTADAGGRLELAGAGEVDEAVTVRAAGVENIGVAFADFFQTCFWTVLEHILNQMGHICILDSMMV